MKKIDKLKASVKENIKLFRCPICYDHMKMEDSYSMICLKNHCYDLSKKGYINLLPKTMGKGYDKDMFESRHIISNSGFFDNMLNELIEIIICNSNVIEPNSERLILDAGCGEGSHLSYILKKLVGNKKESFVGVGIDISKEGIQVASRYNNDSIWCVADLANIPLDQEKADVILNILSPSNYSEFKRVLKKGGMMLKVVPEENYLIELRDIFYRGTEKTTYSNKDVIDKFDENFDILQRKRITYNVEIERANLEHLLNMTPLTWGINSDRIGEALKEGITNITVDLAIIVGKADLV